MQRLAPEHLSSMPHSCKTYVDLELDEHSFANRKKHVNKDDEIIEPKALSQLFVKLSQGKALVSLPSIGFGCSKRRSPGLCFLFIGELTSFLFAGLQERISRWLGKASLTERAMYTPKF